MWFAGESDKCIYRYDGTRLKVFRHDNLDSNSLGGVDVYQVYADKKGFIWVNHGNGLDKLNPGTGIFKHYRHSDTDPNSLSGNGISRILEDHSGRLWIATWSEGLERFDEKTEKFIHYRSDPMNARSLSSNFVFNLYEDHEGVLWVCTGFPFAGVAPNDGGLNRLEADGSFTRFMHDPKDPHSLLNNKIAAVLEDSRGTFWVATNGDGLHTMDRKTGKFERHSYDPKKPNQVSCPPLTDDINEKMTFLAEDRSGAIWIGTMFSGINRYDPALNKVTLYKQSNGYPDGTSWNVFTSRDSVLWITNEDNNLYRVEVNKKQVGEIDVHTAVLRFLEEKDGTLWVAAQRGLLKLDKNKKLLNRYLWDKKNPDSRLNDIASLIENNADTIWVGTQSGFGFFNKRTEEFTRVSLGPPDNEGVGAIVSIIQDDGFFWMSTTNHGVAKFNPRTKSVKWYIADGKPGSIGSNNVYPLFRDKLNSIWVGTGEGLYHLDANEGKFTHFLGVAKIPVMNKDSGGRLWIGTASGLYFKDEKDDSFKAFGLGTVLSRDRTYGIVEDDAKNLWVATESSVVRISPDRNDIFTYGSKVGFYGITPGSLFKTSNGEVLLGNHGPGFFYFSPEKFGIDPQSPSILITEILINNSPLVPPKQPDNVKPSIVEELNELELLHNENSIIFRYTSNDYRAPEATKYFTLLENYDNVWREAAADHATSFHNLPPGTYVYRIKGFNAFGSKMENAITIHIAPPWWKTWWAYSLYGAFGISLMFAGRREIQRRERLRNELKFEHLQLEKAKEVDKVKSTFFTNISHEFRTPLALIKGPLQDLMEKYPSDAKTQEKLGLIQRNSDLLLKLINQLLNLARLESGGQKIDASEFHLNSFFRAVSGSFSSMANQKKIGLQIESPSSNYKVSFDKDKLETILINLINNAIKFTPSGGKVNAKTSMVKLNDATTSTDGAGNYQMIIAVSDNGIGIPVDQQTKIFERFHQVSEAHKEVGTGIGLALVKELVQLMQGTVELKSTLGEGSEFTVTLPITVLQVSKKLAVDLVPEVVTNGAGNSHGEVDHTLQPPSKPHVLVVEDNFDMRKFIIESLGDSYETLEAEDGKEGLEIAMREIPQLIISDVMMPEMDGIEMTGKLRKDFRTSHVPIIMLTAKVSEESKMSGLDTGAHDYITKPFNKHELLLKVRNNIEAGIKMREKLRMELLSEAPKFEAQSADEKFLLKVKETIHQRLSDEQLSVESLAEDIGLSRVQLYRKVIALTGISVNEMIRSFRLQKAAQLLEQNWGSISQITYEVGFSNPSYFSKCFKEQFGVMPSEYVARN
jgi:signal transduction histidine kinase/ligand-binding sensor domain-containing protein/DNA-binding response OmpR family regulator